MTALQRRVKNAPQNVMHAAPNRAHKWLWFRDDVYGVNVYLLCPLAHGATVEWSGVHEFAIRGFENDLEVMPDDVTGRVLSFWDQGKGTRCLLVYVREWDGTPRAYGTLVHECFHVTREVMTARGIDLDSKINSEEAYAYYLDFITRKMLEGLQKLKPKR